MATSTIPKNLNSMVSFKAYKSGISSKNDLDTYLDSLLNNMSAGDVYRFRMSPSASFDKFSSGQSYFSEVFRGGSVDYSRAHFYMNGSRTTIVGAKDMTWSYSYVQFQTS